MPPSDEDKLHEDPQNTENRVRRALGLDRAGAQPTGGPHGGHPYQPGPHGADRPRRRFVQDGEVPVVVVHSERRGEASSRLAELEAALEAERSARAGLARALDDARASVQSLQTRLTHAELAAAETIAAARQARAEAETALQDALQRLAAADPRPLRAAKPEPVRKPAKAARSKTPRSRLVKWWAADFAGKQPA